MGIGRELVADIVQQHGNDEFVGLAGAIGARGALQAMLEAIDTITADAVFEPAQRLEDAVRQSRLVIVFHAVEEFVFLARTVFHANKIDMLHDSVSCCGVPV